MNHVISVAGLGKTFDAFPPVRPLTDVSLSLDAGERLAVFGRSGAGKSTLLNIMGLLMEATSGSYHLLGEDTRALSPRDRDRLRATALGFVFQAHHIIGHRTTMENVALKLTTMGTPRTERQRLIDAALDHLGLSHRAQTLGRLLSGGEKQRLAIARAVVAGPAVLLADEPTGNLDDDNSREVLRLLTAQASAGAAILIITHDRRAASWADRTLTLQDGTLHEGLR